jgi:DNA polymerase-4
MNEIQWLFLDLNAYFASVEQQERPELRGQPVAVVPMNTDTTCCIAASYEAKAYGIKTGTMVREAKALCPPLRLVEARPDLYVRYHHRITQAVDACIPVDTVLSIDEMICQLTGSQTEVEEAVRLAQRIKRAIQEQVGIMLRSSIGLAPNRFLAKVGSDFQKPDGLTVFRAQDLPEKLFDLEVRELPGIGQQMEARLHLEGIHTVRQLAAFPVEEMRRLWGGVWGERMWHWLRGLEVPLPPSHRHSIGHSHVLPPWERTTAGAYEVARRLLSRAAVRLRKENFWARGLTLTIKFMDRDSWGAKARFAETQSTPRFLKVLDELWVEAPRKEPLWVGITFFPMVPGSVHTPELFDNPRQEALSHVMDAINEKYGKDAAYFASLHDSLQQAPTRISFTRIPDLAEF